MTKLLMISMDRKILEKDSAVSVRMKEYGTLFGEMHIVLFALKGLYQETKLAENVFVYPTDSASKYFYISDAIKMGKKIAEISGLSAADSVITSQDPFETGLAAMRISKATGIHAHVQIHTDFLSLYFSTESILNRIRVFISAWPLRHARAIRVVSERIRRSIKLDRVLGHNIDKIDVLPIYVDAQSIQGIGPVVDIHDAYPQFTKIGLIASRLTKEKDISTALKAFKISLHSEQNAGLIIAGSGPLQESLKREAKDMGLGSRVAFESWIGKEKLFSYMRTCDAFISTSLYEGYGLSMVEAHVLGARIVATDAGVADSLTDLVCQVKDESCLAGGISKAFSKSAGRKDARAASMGKAEHLEAYKRDIERAIL